ncbi:hypothetical protein [Pseudomonas sp. CF161]|uniref:hypothetical protein n=1 Tax=Pseudomonas sp. CF161 TaxID=911241 RepID=UPI00035514DA|nr:hypothetical protein [Pseudomonas sp. CF161]EPL05054.1 hypothetical protein CF161_23726 [Pseudomonas sp. CF161]
MLAWIKELLRLNNPAPEQPQNVVQSSPIAQTFEEYLGGLANCDLENPADFYYRTEAAEKWSKYFSTEFTVTCRNSAGASGTLPQDLKMNAPIRAAAAGNLVYVFYYYDSLAFVTKKINDYHLKITDSDTDHFSSSAKWMTLCFLARYKRNSPALVGKQSYVDGTQNSPDCRYIICNSNCITIPREDIQIHLNGHWYSLPAITDPTLGDFMVQWAADGEISGTRAQSLLSALQV